MESNLKDSGEKLYKHSICNISLTMARFSVKQEIIDENESPYECRQCEKAFSHKYVLNRHLRKHIGEKPYQCSHCDTAFTLTNYLKIHMRTHTGEKPCQCSECDKAFSQKMILIYI